MSQDQMAPDPQMIELNQIPNRQNALTAWAEILQAEKSLLHDRVASDNLVQLDGLGRVETITTESGLVIAGAVVFPTQNDFIQEIGAICVSPDHRGKGYMSRIISQVLKKCSNNSWLSMVVSDNQAVIKKFTEFGFSIVESTRVLDIAYPKNTGSSELDNYNADLRLVKQTRIEHKGAVILVDPGLTIS